MKIAQLVDIATPVPPDKYGSTQRIVSLLTEELVRRGHEVTLFASGDSITTARIFSVTPKSLRKSKEYLSILNIGLAYKMQKEFDIIHDHIVYGSLPAAILAKTPVVMTIHGPITVENRKLLSELNNKRNPFFVTISKSQSLPLPNLNYIGNVYHGFNMSNYPFSLKDKNYLLFVGRLSPDKGVHHAIEVAEFLDIPLILAAKLDTIDVSYFKKKIKPHLSEKIRWIGEVTMEQRNKLMSNATAFLHPTSWREPFGLTLIEAMGCGCPVVAFNRGSIPEIIKQGETGYIVEDSSEMVEALTHIKDIKRENCRNYALKNFTLKKMVDEYEAIYEKILKKKLT